MAWPAAQNKAIKPPAISHPFMVTPPPSHRTGLPGQIGQAETDRRAPFSGILEFDKSGIEPTAAMRLAGGFRKSVVAQAEQSTRAVALKQELHRRLPGLKAFDATPSQRDPLVW